MKKTIETVNFNASEELVNYVNNLFDELPKFHDQIISADIYLKQHSGQTVEERETEVKVFLPGHEIFSRASGDSFQESSDLAFSKAKRQLTSLKEKDKNKHQPRADKF